MFFLLNLMASCALVSLASALSSSLQHVTGFTSGPTAAGMYVYIPTTKKSPAPIIVAVHYCTGTANAYFSGTLYAQYADTYGYIVIYPNSPSSGGCWDVSSTATLTHNGGGDSQTIVNMVKYAVSNYGGDSSRVYVTGTSSGAMMTNVLAGAYPDVFKAGSAYSGVADGCFYVAGATAGMATPAWNSQCADGDLIQSAQTWGNLVRSYYPGYTGNYPKMMLWHGTIDTTLYYSNLGEELKEWSNVLGVSFSQNITNTPQSGYTEIVYGDGTKLIGYSAVGVGHTVPVHETVDLAWFCISSPCSGGTSGPSSSSMAPSSTTIAPTTMISSPSVTPTTGGCIPGTTTVSTTLMIYTTMTVNAGAPPPSTTAAPPPSTTTTPSPPPTSTSGGSGGGTIAEWGQCGGIGWTGSGTCAAGTTCVYSNTYYSQCLP